VAYIKAFSLSAAVAFELSDVVISKRSKVSGGDSAFADQHWTADFTRFQAGPSAAPVNERSTTPVPASEKPQMLSVPIGKQVADNAARKPVAIPTAPPVVAIRVLNSATLATALTGVTSLSAVVAHISASANVVLAVDATGHVELFGVESDATHDLQAVAAAPESAALDGKSSVLPHSRIRIRHIATTGHLIPLSPVQHAFSSSSAVDAVADATCSTFPVGVGDMLCGGAVITGAGPGAGIEMHAIDARGPTTSGEQLPVLLGPRASAALSLRKTLGAPGSAGTPGGAPAEARVVGSLALPWSKAGATVTVVAVESDVLAAGLSDGAVHVWRASGLDGLSALTTWPSLRARPDIVLRATNAGAVTSLTVSRDDDLLVAGYVDEVWVFEIARGRPLSRIVLSMGSIAAQSASSFPFRAVCVGTAISAESGLVLGVDYYGKGEKGETQPSKLLLYDSTYATSPAPLPIASASVPGKITCVTRLRSTATGNYEGVGSLVAVGTSQGQVNVFDSRAGSSLAILATWTMPSNASVHCIDIAQDTGYLVAGCAGGVLVALALPALLVTLPSTEPPEQSAMTGAGRAEAQLRAAGQAAKVVASEATGMVKGLFGTMFRSSKQ
jgi:hypothetical protein